MERIDRLSGLLQRFGLHARVERGGTLRGAVHFDDREGLGRLHLVRRGALEVSDHAGRRFELGARTAVLYPRAVAHRLAPVGGPVEIVCAAIEFGPGDENPLLRSLPAALCVPLAELPAMDATLSLVFAESEGWRCGRSAVVDRLTEVLFVHLLRHAIERRIVEVGVVAGLADARLARALTAMHEDPGRAWSLETLAAVAGMSRSRFAARFAAVVGMPAMEYLTRWRIGVAKGLLRRGRPPKAVAVDVGYGRSSTFGRAFSQVVGLTPTAWLRARDG
jgi:AraC-like DNA-binding protein